VTTVGVGGDADATLLGAAARGGGGHFVAWVPGQRVATVALAVIETANGSALRDATLELPVGLTDVAPSRLPTVRAGEQLLVAARLGAGEVRGDVVLRGTVGGQAFEQRYPVRLAPSTAPGNAFVPRLWASLQIDELERGGRGEDRARIVGMSQAYGVLSRHTSLLVLESEAMFEAFGVDRGKPQVVWTGSEELDEVAVDGTIAHADGDGYAAVPAKGKGGGAPMAAASKDDAKAKKAERSDKLEEEKKRPAEPDEDRVRRDPMPPRGRAAGRWMRKVWYRVGAVDPYEGIHPNIVDAIAAAESALAAAPDSRDRHRALVQALAYGGELERAYRVAASWLERDRLDPQALGYLADILGRQGRRGDAVRTLAGVVDLAPDDRDLHERLAAAHERVGATAPACGHRVALAALQDDDAAASGAAIRCLRALGRERDAERITQALPTELLRKRALELADGGPRNRAARSGDLTITAQWTGAADLDLSLISPQGARLSWLGGRKGLSVADAGAVGTERLVLDKIKRGRYLVELSRTRAGDTTPVEGTVEVTVLGVTRTLPFRLDGDRVVLGRIAVTMQSRLEEVGVR
jgi:tetratricopeptide (TPR) repeat protein